MVRKIGRIQKNHTKDFQFFKVEMQVDYKLFLPRQVESINFSISNRVFFDHLSYGTKDSLSNLNPFLKCSNKSK